MVALTRVLLSGLALALGAAQSTIYQPILPGQFRLAFSGENGMTVSWNTKHELKKPTVHYGLMPRALHKKAHSRHSYTYDSSVTWSNHVTLENLIPNTVYYYRVQGTEKVFSFKTAPGSAKKSLATQKVPFGSYAPAKEPNQEFSFALVVDLGTFGPLGLGPDLHDNKSCCDVGKNQLNTFGSLAQHINTYDFVLHPGDFGYADIWIEQEASNYFPGGINVETGHIVYEEVMNAFYDELTAVTAFKPYMVGPGNHEASCLEGTPNGYTEAVCVKSERNFTAFNNHWRMPSDKSGGVANMWYSFDYGHAHFVQINTETDLGEGITGYEEKGGGYNLEEGPFGPKNAQIDWLKNDLAKVNRTETPWVIVMGHRPWYDANSPCWPCRLAFEKILVDNHVDAVLHGHEHNMQRWDPIAYNVTDPRGLNDPNSPWYIVSGATGNYERIRPFKTPLPSGIAFANDKTYGWSRVTVHNRTHMTHEYIESATGQILDRSTLYKSHKL